MGCSTWADAEWASVSSTRVAARKLRAVLARQAAVARPDLASRDENATVDSDRPNDAQR